MLLRAPWPFVPRPAVLPRLPPTPRPTRVREVFAPGAGCRSWTFISDLFDGDEVRHPGDHAADLRTVGQLDGVVDTTQAECADRAALLGLRADRRLHLGDAQRCGHDGSLHSA